MKTAKRIATTLVAAGLLGLSWIAPVVAVVVPTDPIGLQIAIEAQERHTDVLMSVEGVVGTAVGVRGDGRPVIKIFTETAGIPGLPRRLEGHPVVVEVTGKIFARHHGKGSHSGNPPEEPPDGSCDRTARCPRPVPIGISTGHPDITAGTIGARVTDGVELPAALPNVYALSNNHVYANENLASIEDAVIQPGAFDGGSSPADDIGTLADFEPIVFSISANNVIDAAIALTSVDDLGNATPSDGYGTPRSQTVTASINQRVMKYGRTTGLTHGRVIGINATVNVGYDTGIARFVNQIIIDPGNFSAPGDSGSLIVIGKGKHKRKPVGLLFAGSTLITVANPIGPVLTRFGVTVDGN